MRKTISLTAALAFAAGLAAAQTIDKDLAEFQAQAGARAQARAEAQRLPWEQIDAKFAPDWPVMPFEGHQVSVFDLCATGTSFELRGPKKTIEVCRDHGYDERRCLRSENVVVSIPAAFTREECPDQRDEYRDCAHPVKVSYVRPASYQVDVYERGLHEDRVAMFTKAYSIPACR